MRHRNSVAILMIGLLLTMWLSSEARSASIEGAEQLPIYPKGVSEPKAVKFRVKYESTEGSNSCSSLDKAVPKKLLKQVCSQFSPFSNRTIVKDTIAWITPEVDESFVTPEAKNYTRMARTIIAKSGRFARDNYIDIVTLRLEIDDVGRIVKCDVMDKSGNENFDNSVCNAVANKKWYRPAKQDGRPISSVLFTRARILKQ